MLVFFAHFVVFKCHDGRAGEDAEGDEVFESGMALDVVGDKLIRVDRWILLSLQIQPNHLLLRFNPLDLMAGHQ